ncbi:MAG: sigma-70 family RNA polymerase sigma factor [Planctomycetes bacterium]|nr:sigma-70 family RNA polymerase sigma factor [Planctomycetota bacterium]
MIDEAARAERTELLVAKARSGDREAFGELVALHQDLVFRVVRRTSQVDAGTAEDLAQETFLRAFRALDSFRGECSFLHWLLRIASNLTINRAATAAVRAERRAVSLDAPRAAEGEAGMDPADDTERGPAARMERLELIDALDKALQRLPEEFRAAVVLRDVEGLEYDAIAEVLSIPIGTVRSRLHRGREALREIVTRTHGVPVEDGGAGRCAP